MMMKCVCVCSCTAVLAGTCFWIDTVNIGTTVVVGTFFFLKSTDFQELGLELGSDWVRIKICIYLYLLGLGNCDGSS